MAVDQGQNLRDAQHVRKLHVPQRDPALRAVARETRHMPASFIESAIGPLLPFERVTPVSEEDVTPFRPS